MKPRNPFKRKSNFNINNPEHVIQLAFVHKGIEYFCFTDIYKVNCNRAMHALPAYEELAMRMTKDYMVKDLEAHQKLNADIMEMLSGKTGGVNLNLVYEKMKVSNLLLTQKKERLEWIFEPEALYKIASVLYFDKNENPYQYDEKYCATKIESWKKDTEVLAFFLKQPIQKYVPYSTLSNSDLDTYLKVLEAQIQVQWENIFTTLSGNIPNSDLKA